jgi:hypothetical protein
MDESYDEEFNILQYAIDPEILEPKETVEYWNAYLKSKNRLHKGEIREYKIQRALEKAKLLSVNSEFQAGVEKIREKWGINPSLPTDFEDLYPDVVIKHRVFGAEPNENELKELLTDLKKLCESCGMDWRFDFGLIVTSICFGLTAEDILNNWEEISFTAAKEASPGVEVVLFRKGAEDIKKMGVFLTIAYLGNLLSDSDVNLNTLPVSIREWLNFSIECTRIDEGFINPSLIPNLIKEMKACPKDEPDGEVEIYLRIRPETVKADVDRTWPQVEMAKLEFWGETPARGRIWINYERDIFIWKKVNEEGMTYENAYDEWLIKQPDDEVVEISAIIKAVRQVDKISIAKKIMKLKK